MKKKNSGFTLVELLAVIVVLAVIVTLASGSVVAIMNKSRKNMAQEVRNNLKEVAVAYVLENYHLEKCSVEFSEEIDKNPAILDTSSNVCLQRVEVEDMLNAGLFEDSRGFCEKSDNVIVYRYSYKNDSDEINSEYKAYISENACNN